jgi:arylformamidase
MSRVIDLTLPLAPGDSGVRIEPVRSLEKDGWNATTLSLYSHCGTHMDAPVHFGVGTQTIDTVPVESPVGEYFIEVVMLSRANVGSCKC